MRPRGQALGIVAIAAMLGGCATNFANSTTALGWIEEKGNPRPSLEMFAVCHDYGCASRTEVQLAPAEWQEIRDVFQPPPADAGEERERIKLAVARLELMTGRRAGTHGDKGGTLNAISLPGQMDCVDEAVTTTTYLVLLQEDGLIKLHRPETVAWRGQLFGGKMLPHVTPVMTEIGSGERWAVDASFSSETFSAAPVATKRRPRRCRWLVTAVFSGGLWRG
jgi:hypothetical protein